MDVALGVDTRDLSLRALVKLYRKRSQEIEESLAKQPSEWGRFQSEFNAEVDAVFRSIMNFEKENLAQGRENVVYKLKRLFVKRYQQYFLRGVYGPWSFNKPFGYAGDYKIINDIYDNSPTTRGFDRLFDNYFQMSAISVAVRNRKEDFRRLIVKFLEERKGKKTRIMDLASGPCRELHELFTLHEPLTEKLTVDCYDNDEHALAFAQGVFANIPAVQFAKANAVRLALAKDVSTIIDKKYDFIYSTGLFDYFTEKIAIRLVRALKALLNPGGVLAIASVRDKYSNPSVHFMEWVGDWNLVYRDDDEFRKIFLEAGFKENEFEAQYEQQGIIQYIIATQAKT